MPGLDLQHCVDLWNGSSVAGPQSSMAALVANYVSVTFSDLYPGKCLITAANSELNLLAESFDSDGESYAVDQVGSGEATTLPVSVTQWNASANQNGYLKLSP